MRGAGQMGTKSNKGHEYTETKLVVIHKWLGVAPRVARLGSRELVGMGAPCTVEARALLCRRRVSPLFAGLAG